MKNSKFTMFGLKTTQKMQYIAEFKPNPFHCVNIFNDLNAVMNYNIFLRKLVFF